MLHVDGREHPRVLDQVADTVASERVYPLNTEVFGDIEVVLREDVVALGRVALEVAHEEEGRPAVLLVAVDLVVGEVSGAPLVDNHLGGWEVEGGDLPPYLLGAEFVDQVVGNEFPDVSYAGQTLDQDRSADIALSQKGYSDVFHLRTALLYLPYLSSGEKRAGWAGRDGRPQTGQRSESVYLRSCGQRRMRLLISFIRPSASG